MRPGGLTPQEAAIIHRLLAERGITSYELVEPVSEGRTLPGSHDEYEIESVSGILVTPTKVYGFWLDWDPVNSQYTLGEHKGYWQEVGLDGIHPPDVIEAQQRLRQGGE